MSGEFVVFLHGYGDNSYVAMTTAKRGVNVTTRDKAWRMSKTTADALVRRLEDIYGEKRAWIEAAPVNTEPNSPANSGMGSED